MKYNNPRILLYIHCKMDAIVKKNCWIGYNNISEMDLWKIVLKLNQRSIDFLLLIN